jgi:short-subunit dehydrogenase
MDDMLTRKSGYILQVASIAGFTAMPTYAIYGATKSFVMNFGEALNTELKGSGVSVSTLTPGTTRTEFFDISGHEMVGAQGWMLMDSMPVSKIGIKGMLKRKSIIIPGLRNILLITFMKFAPRTLIAKMSYKLLKKN